VGEGERGKIIDGGDNASGTLMVKALKPLNLKKDSGLLTGLSYS
jgi:hypothetical protein